MPKQGGQGKGKPKLKDRNFGKALIRQRLQNEAAGTSRKEQVQMLSILDNSALDDYVLSQEMGGQEPEVYRPRYDEAIIVQPVLATVAQTLSAMDYDFQHLRIPRKPSWTTSMTAEEVDRREKNEFLNWRRYIAGLEDSSPLKVTPFEKNLEVWRQLWRVLERSDMAIQIVDARNPLLYYTNDLEKYAAEHTPARPMLLVVNKADYLTEFQRRAWARRFTELGLRFVFYSAKLEQEKIDKAALHTGRDAAIEPIKLSEADADSSDDLEAGSGSGSDDDSASDSEEKEADDAGDEDDVHFLAKKLVAQSLANRETLSTQPPTKVPVAEVKFVWGEAEAQHRSLVVPTANDASPRGDDERRSAAILNRFQLIQLLSDLCQEFGLTPQTRHGHRYCIGMLGYPNVGKSSVINSLLEVAKSTHDKVRVAVSSTPGKTKHFQTLMLSDEVMLCDCPGLVFPSFMNSTGEMLCAGILPINQMRDYVAPATVISSRIPQHLLEAAYGMHIHRELDFKDNPSRPPNAHEFLIGYCKVKGYITNGTGRWDEFRACKELLRDFNDGRILFVATPFTEDPSDPDSVAAVKLWRLETEKIMMRNVRVAERLASSKLSVDVLTSGNGAAVSSDAVSAHPQTTSNQMVFGDIRQAWNQPAGTTAAEEPSTAPVREAAHDGGIEFDDESSASEAETEVTGSVAVADGKDKREHKRLKHWGKKNKKLRDKDPYGEANGVVSYAVYSTNRAKTGVVKPEEELHRRRQDPRSTYGTEYVRAIHPHHDSKELGGNLQKLHAGSKVQIDETKIVT